jgi:AmiR/NasT family two-component response regulator
VIVEQAKGVLAQIGGLTMDVAFDRLRRHARSHNLLLVEVARRIVTKRGVAREVLGIKVR